MPSLRPTRSTSLCRLCGGGCGGAGEPRAQHPARWLPHGGDGGRWWHFLRRRLSWPPSPMVRPCLRSALGLRSHWWPSSLRLGAAGSRQRWPSSGRGARRFAGGSRIARVWARASMWDRPEGRRMLVMATAVGVSDEVIAAFAGPRSAAADVAEQAEHGGLRGGNLCVRLRWPLLPIPALLVVFPLVRASSQPTRERGLGIRECGFEHCLEPERLGRWQWRRVLWRRRGRRWRRRRRNVLTAAAASRRIGAGCCAPAAPGVRPRCPAPARPAHQARRVALHYRFLVSAGAARAGACCARRAYGS